jgi:hypothetical protein
MQPSIYDPQLGNSVKEVNNSDIYQPLPDCTGGERSNMTISSATYVDQQYRANKRGD